MLRLVTKRAARHAARAVAPACNVAFQRGYAEGGDIVKDVFLNQQKQFRALLDATKDLEVPVNGDRAAIKAYAEKRKAIMQKLGIMTTEERIEATLASGVEPGQSARDYLAFAAAQRSAMGLEDVSGLGKALDEALAAVEKAAGKPLMMDDAAGMKAFYAKVESAVAGAGLDGDLALESMVNDAENEIKHLKSELAKNK